jgi:DNA replication protein DnaC
VFGQLRQRLEKEPGDLETYDFSAMPSLSKQKILEWARGQWIDQNTNAGFIGNAGTGKRVRFFTAAMRVNQREEARKQYRLERMTAALEKLDLLIVDEPGYPIRVHRDRSG